MPTLLLLQRRMMRVLVVAQLLGALGLAAGGTAGALLAERLTGNPAAAGLPLSLLVLGSGVSAVAVARIMRGHGRRVGLAAAYLAGTVGAALVVAAAAWGSWPLLLAGSGLLGGGNAAVMLARYAAADLASRRGRAISTVVTAASVGAIAGPNLLGPAGVLARAVGLPAPTGLFLLAVPAFLGAALVLLAFLRPDPLQLARSQAPSAEEPAAADGRGELAALLGDRHVRLALLVLAVANLAMVGVMAVAPVHLHDHGAGMGTIGLMVGAHIAAMYLPSPVTGWLSDTLGARVVASMGALLLLAAGAVAAVAGAGRPGIMGALLLLGVGWNAGLIGGSALLRDAPISPSLRTRAEGLGELGMGAAAAAGGSGAGLLLATGGVGLLGPVAAAPCLLILAAVAATHKPHPGSAGDARPGSGNTTHLSVASKPTSTSSTSAGRSAGCSSGPLGSRPQAPGWRCWASSMASRSSSVREWSSSPPSTPSSPTTPASTSASCRRSGTSRGHRTTVERTMLPNLETLARDQIQDLLNRAEHARPVARLRSLQRARRRAATPTAATAASNKPAAPATAPLHAGKHGAAGDGRATVGRHQPSAR